MPASLPFIVSGMKQGWAFAWRSLMAAEIYVTILTGFGLGHLLHYGRELQAMDQVIGIMLVSAVSLFWGKLYDQAWLLWVLMCSLPLPFIANTAGWMTAEFGRQPWIIYNVMRTADGIPLWTSRLTNGVIRQVYAFPDRLVLSASRHV